MHAKPRLIRHVSYALLSLVLLLLIVDLARVFFFTPGRVEHVQFNDSQISLEVSPRYLLTADGCVTVLWHIENLTELTLNGVQIGHDGETQLCNQQFRLEDTVTGDLSGVQVSGQLPGIRNVLIANAPVYILSQDVLWLWRVVAIGAAVAVMFRISAPGRQWRLPGWMTRVVFFTWCAVFLVVVLIYGEAFNIGLNIYLLLASGLRWPDMSLSLYSIFNASQFVIFSASQLLVGAFVIKLAMGKALSSFPFLTLPTALCMGIGMSALFFIVIALLGALTKPLIYLWVLFCLGIGGAGAGRDVFREIDNAVQEIRKSIADATPLERLLWIIITVLVIAPLFRLMGPMTNDGIVIYMLQARLFALTGAIAPPPDGLMFHYQASGMVGELHFAALYLLGGEHLARAHSYLLFLCSASLAFALAGQLNLDRLAQLLVLFAVMTSSILTVMVTNGKVEIYAVCASLAVFNWMLLFRSDDYRRIAFVIGLLCGILTLAKITYAPITGLPLAIVSMYLFSKGNLGWTKLLQSWAIIAWVGLCIVAFHSLRLGVTLGEPFAPFVYLSDDSFIVGESVFGTSWIEEPDSRKYRILYPLLLPIQQHFLTYGTFTPLWIALLPLSLKFLWNRQENNLLYTLVVAAIITLVIWLASVYAVVQFRYIVTLLILVFIPGIVYLSDNLKRGQYHYEGRVIIFIICVYAVVSVITGSIVHGLLGLRQQTTDVFVTVNNAAPTGARVFSNSYFDYFLRDDLLLCASTGMERIPMKDMTHEQKWIYLYQRGFDYVLDTPPSGVNNSITFAQFFKRNIPLDPTQVGDRIKLNVLYEEDNTTLYQLTDVSDSLQRLMSCQENELGTWQVK